MTFTIPIDGLHPTLKPEQRNIHLVHTGSLSSIPPSIKILCTTVLPDAVHSFFYVFFDDILLNHESVDLELLPGVDVNGNVQYTTKLIPQYWATLLQAPDLSRYTITHDVIKIASIDAGQIVQDHVLLNVSHRFNTVHLSRYLPPLELHVPGVPHLGPGVLIYAPQPLLLDATNASFSVPLAPASHDWYDCRGTTTSVTNQDASYDFISVGEAELSRYCRLEQLSGEPISYLNFAHNW